MHETRSKTFRIGRATLKSSPLKKFKLQKIQTKSKLKIQIKFNKNSKIQALKAQIPKKFKLKAPKNLPR